MDQPYSRIADALLDYQVPGRRTIRSRTPYDDTGWTFPEGFAVQAVRVLDPKVLDAPVELVKTAVRPLSGVAGEGSLFAINHNADNALITLRYKLKSADMQIAEEPFEAAGQKFARGSFIIRDVAASDLDAATKEVGLRAHALPSAPTVKTHPARAARVALMHTWQSTQTEGWWRQALDLYGIPYDYISTQDVANEPNLRAKYDVILFGPGGGAGQAVIDGLPMWRNPMPWKKTDQTPNLGGIDETDDIRPGLGWTGLMHLEDFIKKGGVYVGAVGSAQFALQFGLTDGVSANTAATGSRVVGSLLRTKIVDDAHPIVYGIPDNLAVYSDAGGSFTVSSGAGGRGGGGGGAAAAAGGRGGGPGPRATGRGTPDDPDVPQGRPALDPRNEAPARGATPRPWQYAIPTEDQLRTPLNIIPPDLRPRVALRFADQNELLVSGLLQGGADIAQRPVVVSVPSGQGHVVLFANNPIWRGETIGSYFMVWNAILNFDELGAGGRSTRGNRSVRLQWPHRHGNPIGNLAIDNCRWFHCDYRLPLID